MTTLILALLLAAPAQAQTPIRCCDQPEVQQAVAGVAAVAAALAKGGDGQDDLAALRDRISIPDDLPEAERDVLERMRRSAKAGAMKTDGARQTLAFLSRHAVWLALRHEGGNLVLAEGWCPEQGGWLQRDLDTLRSPWGSCGAWR